MGEGLTLSIPTDEEGFAAMQCPYCGEHFKVDADDYNADDVLDLWCPCCGLTADCFLPQEVIELAEAMVLNKLSSDLSNEFAKIGNSTSSNAILSFSVNASFAKERERNIIPSVDAYEPMICSHCGRTTKVKPLVQYIGGFCAFCGERL